MGSSSYSEYIKHWQIDSDIVFLNHGSFGALPHYVREQQTNYQNQLHRDPIKFFVRDLEPLWWKNKNLLANFLGTKSSNITLIKNATQGVNTILNNISWSPGDVVLTTNHVYGACYHNLQILSNRYKIQIDITQVPFPIHNEDEVVNAILEKVNSKTKVLLIDHVTSATGLIFPIKKIIEALKNTEIIIVVDGAHAPGMLDLNLENLKPHYYTGNCHKWMYTPNGCAFICVREDLQKDFLPNYISHYYDKPLEDEHERWSSQFFWQGTDDNTAQICITDSFDFVHQVLKMDWNSIRNANNLLLLEAREKIGNMLQIEPMAPTNMLGNLCTFPLEAAPDKPPFGFNYFSPWGKVLFEKYKIEIPIFRFQSHNPQWYFRISPQLYNHISQYEYLASAISELFKNRK